MLLQTIQLQHIRIRKGSNTMKYIRVNIHFDRGFDIYNNPFFAFDVAVF